MLVVAFIFCFVDSLCVCSFSAFVFLSLLYICISSCWGRPHYSLLLLLLLLLLLCILCEEAVADEEEDDEEDDEEDVEEEGETERYWCACE